jgi:hypothetical protein
MARFGRSSTLEKLARLGFQMPKKPLCSEEVAEFAADGKAVLGHLA